jgi:hypothetical protein
LQGGNLSFWYTTDQIVRGSSTPRVIRRRVRSEEWNLGYDAQLFKLHTVMLGSRFGRLAVGVTVKTWNVIKLSLYTTKSKDKTWETPGSQREFWDRTGIEVDEKESLGEMMASVAFCWELEV